MSLNEINDTVLVILYEFVLRIQMIPLVDY